MPAFATLLPRPLAPGDTIGVAAPAGTFAAQRFQAGLDVLDKLGFTVAVPKPVYNKKRYLAGSDADRAAVVNRLFADPSVRAIFCARGGFGAMRLLPLLNFSVIRKNPKILAGFSDISILLTVIAKKTGLVTFHAPVVTSLAEADAPTLTALMSVLTSRQALRLKPEKPLIVRGGQAEGVVLGGNLASICHLIGTPYQPNFDGSLLFLEETGEAAYRIDRMLTQMRLSGCLEKVAGLLLGRFDRCGPNEVIYEIVQEHVSGSIPILGGLDIGHNGLNLTLPVGLRATVNTAQGVLAYHESAVS